ncbi:MAG: hypothetical protein ACMUJM_01680 [bacterium]
MIHQKHLHFFIPLCTSIILFFCARFALPHASATAHSDDPVTRKKTVIEGKHITATVPSDAVEILRPQIAQLDEIFAFMCQEAGYTPKKKLVVIISDEHDILNGWATYLPRPVVELNLSPGSYGAFFFPIDRRLELIAIHEFTHILNMEPNYGMRGLLEDIFGRIIPNDALSLLLFYFSTPPQATMPTFWLEGMAQWAETKYSPPYSIWGGRGRDTYTHMIWRLDAAEGKIPEVDEWRSSYIHWPEGSMPYNYGLAYTRYLDSVYGDKASVWDLALNQAKNWPFFFREGSLPLLPKNHAVLIEEARSTLLEEQEDILRQLNAVPPTPVRRLTPIDHKFGPPAWTSDDRLFASAYRPYASRNRYVYIDKDGNLEASNLPAYEITAVRRSPGGSLVTSNLIKTPQARLRSRISIVRPSGTTINLGLRLAQPDLSEHIFGDADGLMALHFTSGGGQELCVYRFDGENLVHMYTLPSQGIPWSPTFRPKGNRPLQEIAWVETDEQSSQLVLAPLDDLSHRKVLISLRGRIIHPCWNSDGSELFYCSDVTGVSNAYRLKVSQEGTPLAAMPVTHTIGGIHACVPSPDSKELAIIDHDRSGPFIARIPNNPDTDLALVPEIAITWPSQAASFIEPPHHHNPPSLKEYPYNGLRHLEFQYWTPTTMVTDTGGIGIQIAIGDPVGNHLLNAGIGEGYETDKGVGQAYYGYYGGARTNILLTGFALESTFTERVVSLFGELFNYTEYIRGGTASLEFELSGIETQCEAVLGVGYRHSEAVESVADIYAQKIIISSSPFEGKAQFAQAILYYNDTTFYPTSYNPEDGVRFSLFYRHSGYGMGGDLDQKRALAEIGYVFTIAPQRGHQFETRAITGWSDGDLYLQGAFTMGGNSFDGSGIPRGYPSTITTGPYLGAYTAAYRFPLYRPFKGIGTTPFEIRQVVLENFFDAGIISPDEPFGQGNWFRSVGAELTLDMRFFNIPLRPGFQFTRQLDGNEDSHIIFVLRGLF